MEDFKALNTLVDLKNSVPINTSSSSSSSYSYSTSSDDHDDDQQQQDPSISSQPSEQQDPVAAPVNSTVENNNSKNINSSSSSSKKRLRISLTKEEIGEDLVKHGLISTSAAAAGKKIPKSSRKRPRRFKKIIHKISPGINLDGVSADEYRIVPSPDSSNSE